MGGGQQSLDVAIRRGSGFSRLTDRPEGGNETPELCEGEASKWSELRLGCHPDTLVIAPCPERTQISVAT